MEMINTLPLGGSDLDRGEKSSPSSLASHVLSGGDFTIYWN